MQFLRKTLMILLFIFLFFSLTKNLFDFRKTFVFYKSFRSDYEKEAKQHTKLKTDSLRNSDKIEVEKTIRNKLNMLKENEVAVILPQPSPTPKLWRPTPAPNYIQWYNLFFGE